MYQDGAYQESGGFVQRDGGVSRVLPSWWEGYRTIIMLRSHDVEDEKRGE